MTNSPGVPAPTPYHVVTDDHYGEQVATSFDASPIQGGNILSGLCPRCADAMTFPQVKGVFRTIWPGRPKASTAATTLPMNCRCTEEHPGRPNGKKGCGAYWNITVTPA